MTGDKVDEIYTWIDQVPFSKPKKNMLRDFSDGVMMAELLKHFYPKLVELHNYSPANCLSVKINNWATLNKKVLSKIGIKLQKQQIEQLASATPNTIVEVLTAIRNKINSISERKTEQKQTDPLILTNFQQSTVCLVQEGTADSVLGLPVAYEPGNGQRLVIALESMVPQRQLDEKLAEIAQKDEAISTLEYKVSHLDTLLRLKDQRIKDLTQQLHVMQDRNRNFGNVDQHFSISSNCSVELYSSNEENKQGQDSCLP